MKYWLVKSDPGEYGWEDLLKERKTDWTGVRNYAARLHLNGMKKGDAVLFYHSNREPAVIGEAKVTREAFPDPTAQDDKWVAVELEAGKSLGKPVSLQSIKAEKRLADIGLVRIGRLSVMPLQKPEYETIVKMGR